MIVMPEFQRRLRNLLLVACGLTVVVCLQAIAEEGAASASSGGPDFSREELKQIEALEAQSNVFRAIAKKVGPAVVSIQAKSRQEAKDIPNLKDLPEPLRKFFEENPNFRNQEPRFRTGMGSGVIVDAANGFILTNNHVVAGEGRITVKAADKREFTAKVVGSDVLTDLAVIQIQADALRAIPIGDSDRVEVGDWVIAAGNPFGLEQSFTRGMVSAKGRDTLRQIMEYADFIQTDAAINPGNSGGPLVNLRGEMIGLNTAIATNSAIQGNVGVGFAIPSKVILQILPMLKAGRRVVRGYLGVEAQDLNPGLARSYGLDEDEGALVNSVRKGSPADDAGLRHDDVILAVDGQPIINAAGLRWQIAGVAPNTTVELKIWRDQKEKSVKVKISEQPEDLFADARGQPGVGEEEDFAAVKELGMEVRNLTPALAKQFQLEKDGEGVVVVKVEPLGEADARGIRVGDVIQEVQGGKVKTAGELREALKKYPLKNGVRFFIKSRQGGVNVYVKIQQ